MRGCGWQHSSLSVRSELNKPNKTPYPLLPPSLPPSHTHKHSLKVAWITMTGATDGCQLTPSTFPAPCTTSSGPAVTWGPWLRGLWRQPPLNWGQLLWGSQRRGAKACAAHYTQTSLCLNQSSSCSCYRCLIPPIRLIYSVTSST